MYIYIQYIYIYVHTWACVDKPTYVHIYVCVYLGFPILPGFRVYAACLDVISGNPWHGLCDSQPI